MRNLCLLITCIDVFYFLGNVHVLYYLLQFTSFIVVEEKDTILPSFNNHDSETSRESR